MDLPITIITFISYFLVVDIAKDSDGYNLLLERIGHTSKHMTKDLVSYNTQATDLQAGKIYHLRLTAECVKVYEILEGRGSRGWRPEDDWYVNGQGFICSTIAPVELISKDTLAPCEDYSTNCDFRNIKPYPIPDRLKQHIFRD